MLPITRGCLIYGLVLDGQGGARRVDAPVPPEQIGPQETLWLHCDYSNDEAVPWLAALGLGEFLVDSLVRNDTRPRAVIEPDGLLVVLRGVNNNPGADPEDMVSVRVWLEPGRIVSVRQRKLQPVMDVRLELESGRGPRDAIEWLQRLMERISDRISEVVEDIEARVVGFELALEGPDPSAIRARIAPTRRQIAALRRFLAPQRDALEHLHRAGKERFDEDTIFLLREQSDRITRYVEDLELARERTVVVGEELNNRSAEEQNARTYLFSIIAAVFLPITFITGVFGMNVAGMPGLQDPAAFWFVAAGLAAIVAGTLLLLRWKRWF